MCLLDPQLNEYIFVLSVKCMQTERERDPYAMYYLRYELPLWVTGRGAVE